MPLPRIDLTRFSSVFHFYTPWKRYKTLSFLTFSGGVEMEHCALQWNIIVLVLVAMIVSSNWGQWLLKQQ